MIYDECECKRPMLLSFFFMTISAASKLKSTKRTQENIQDMCKHYMRDIEFNNFPKLPRSSGIDTFIVDNCISIVQEPEMTRNVSATNRNRFTNQTVDANSLFLVLFVLIAVVFILGFISWVLNRFLKRLQSQMPWFNREIQAV